VFFGRCDLFRLLASSSAADGGTISDENRRARWAACTGRSTLAAAEESGRKAYMALILFIAAAAWRQF